METFVQLPTTKGPCFVNTGQIACIHPFGKDTYVFIKGQPKPILIDESPQVVFMMIKESNNET